MKRIGLITDKDILGTDGLSNAQPRITARAVIRNLQNRYAVLYAQDFQLHSLPGGGVEDGEMIEEALKREVAEETGVNILKVEKLGYVEENRAYCDYTQISHYFIVTTDSNDFSPRLTEEEAKHNTTVDWYSFEEAYDLIVSAKHTTVQRKYLQARDVLALREYMKHLK